MKKTALPKSAFGGLFILITACSGGSGSPADGSPGADSGSDADSDSDTDADTDSSTETETDTEMENETCGTGWGWLDETTGYCWQNPLVLFDITFQETVDYCENLTLGNHDDWRVPTISEIRTLVRGCPGTEADGACEVTDECSSATVCFDAESCGGCETLEGPGIGGCYWDPALTGECKTLWSSVELADDSSYHWSIMFGAAVIFVENNDDNYAGAARCVRDAL